MHEGFTRTPTIVKPTHSSIQGWLLEDIRMAVVQNKHDHNTGYFLYFLKVGQVWSKRDLGEPYFAHIDT